MFTPDQLVNTWGSEHALRTAFTQLTTFAIDRVPGWLWRGIGLAAISGLTLIISLNRDRMQDFATLGYVGAFMAMLLSNATVVLPAPGLVIVFALGSSFNPILIGLAAAVGATLGEITGYLAGAGGVGFIENSPLAQRVRGWMERNGSLTIFGLSIIPSPFFDIAGIMAGAGRMRLRHFLTVAFAGKSIQALLIAFAGAYSFNWIEPWLTH